MYTQSFNTKTNENNIVTFPNKDSIFQMNALKAKCETKKHENEKTNQISCTTWDNLLLFGVLMSITDDENIMSTLFILISGILLSM